MKNWFSDRQLTFLIAMNVAIVLLAVPLLRRGARWRPSEPR